MHEVDITELAAEAVRMAMADPAVGLELIESLLALRSGVPEAHATWANLAYNRAAMLRELGRHQEAGDAYVEVEVEFGGHDSPWVGIWVALALYNHASLLLETADDDIVLGKLPALAAELREKFWDSESPEAARRARIASQWERQLYLRCHLSERAEDVTARIRERMRPTAERFLALLVEEDDQRPIGDEGSPLWPTPQEEIALSLLDCFDAILDTVRELADADPADKIDTLFQHPDLMTGTVIRLVQAVGTGMLAGAQNNDDEGVLMRGLHNLASMTVYLNEQEPQRRFLGSGPIEQLLANVDVSASMADALRGARTAHCIASLSLPYVRALIADFEVAAKIGQWRLASRGFLLLLAATERLPDTKENERIVAWVRLRWLFTAKEAFRHLPDGRLLRNATLTGERLALWARNRDDVLYQAEVLLALATLYIDTYLGGRPTAPRSVFFADLRRWIDRITEEPVDPVELPDGTDTALPTLEQALSIGEAYLEQALSLAVQPQMELILGLKLTLYGFRLAMGETDDLVGLAALGKRAEEIIDAERHPQLMLNALMAQAGADPERTRAGFARLLSRSIEEIEAASGLAAAIQVLSAAGQFFAATDRAKGRALFAETAAFRQKLTERYRMLLMRSFRAVMFDGSYLGAGEPDPAFAPEQAVLGMFDLANREGWSGERTALAVLALAGAGQELAEDFAKQRDWLTVLNSVSSVFEAFGDRYGDLVLFISAAALGDRSVQAAEAENWDACLRFQGESCAGYLQLNAPDAAMESLNIMVGLVKQLSEAGLIHGAHLSQAALEALGPLAVRAENLIGAPATTAMQTIWAHVIGAVDTDDDLPALLACLEIAKGARFAQALWAGTSFDALEDAEAARILDGLARLPEIESGAELDEFALVLPYVERLDTFGALGPAEMAENLRRTFDALVQRRLSAEGDQRTRLMGITTVLDALPPDVIVLWFYVARHPEGGAETVTLFCTDQGIVHVPTRIQTAEEEGERFQRVLGGKIQNLNLLHWLVADMRSSLLEEPGPLRQYATSAHSHMEHAFPTLFGQVTDLLDAALAAGRRRLVVIPHGPFHFAPLHLCHFNGRPLTDTFTVTYLPSLQLHGRPRAPVRNGSPLATFGLGFADGSLDSLPEAIAESREVAAEFGVEALTDDAATSEAIFAALSSARRVHIATHGEHDVVAPAFQCLYAADRPIYAYEFLRLDLSGLELVTLSACETALGRVDAADNPRGIPANLLLRGAGAIIGTLWQVETRTSRDFFTHLYRELRRHPSVSAAFAAAQQYTRENHPQYRDWGAFYYVGDWQ